MPYARCRTCGKVSSWSNRRGVRLAALRCPAVLDGARSEGRCMGRLEACDHDGKPRPRRAETRPMAECGACGRRGRIGARLQTLPFVAIATGHREDPGPHPASTPLCWYHQVRAAEPVHPRPQVVHETVCPHNAVTGLGRVFDGIADLARTLTPGEVVVLTGYATPAGMEPFRRIPLPRFLQLEDSVLGWSGLGAVPTSPVAERIPA